MSRSAGRPGRAAIAAGGIVRWPTTPQTVVYVSNAGSKEIFVFAMDRDTGDLTEIERVPVPGTDKPSPTSIPMAVSPDRRFLYAALRSEPFPVSSFAIDQENGRLADLGTAPLADSMAYIMTDRSGRFLLSASYPGAKLAINPIDARAVSARNRPRCWRPDPRRIASSLMPPTATSTAPISAPTSSCSCGSTLRPARCRRTSPPRFRPNPTPGRAIWRFTRTGGFFIC